MKVLIGRHTSLQVLQMAFVLGFVCDASVVKGAAQNGDLQKCQALTPSSKFVHKETAAAACESGSLETVRFFVEERGADVHTDRIWTQRDCIWAAANKGFTDIVRYLYPRQTDNVHNWHEALMSGAAAGSSQ